MMSEKFTEAILSILPRERCLTDAMHCLAWGTDAGFYRLLPKMVLFPKTEAEMCGILRAASQHGVPLTFRASGTALSGQAVTDSVLVVAAAGWEGYHIGPEGETIRLQPGLLGQRVNDILQPYGRKFSPDPASVKAARIGGIVANNASGMNCGTHANADKILCAARLILADGTLLDTASQADRDRFAQSHPRFLETLEAIRKSVVQDEALRRRIAYKYSIKNVTGLNLLPLITHTDPFDIMAHLVVGSEGTLAFLAEATVHTEKILPFKASAMVYFKDIGEACKAVRELKKQPVVSAELLDRLSLRSVEGRPGVPDFLSRLGPSVTALLLETQAPTQEVLDGNIALITAALAPFEMPLPYEFTSDPAVYGPYWEIRSGIFPSVGGMRPAGSCCLIEDVAFHLDDLPQAAADLQEIIARHGYADGVIYGHALEGNLHFILNQRFDKEEERARYQAMMDEVISLVVDRYDGSLKAEHGTGRNMAPFVAREWGDKAWDVMKRLKHLFDPYNLLNPGVIFNEDPSCHLRHIKPLPLLFPEVDKCMECGFCEPHCVTYGFGLSSRQRIVVQREMARLKATGENPRLLKTYAKSFRYAGRAICAGDGLCSRGCPMDISTGDLIHRLRGQVAPPHSFLEGVSRYTARHLSGVKSALRGVLTLARTFAGLLGNKTMSTLCKGLHAMGFPLWTPAMPSAFKLKDSMISAQKPAKNKVVYFPSCLNQTMGPAAADTDRRPLIQVMIHLIQKAGYEAILPPGRENLCCGTIWESKGMQAQADAKTAEVEAALWEASEHGRWPVLCDQSPCLYRLRTKITSMKLYEPAEFIETFLVPHLTFTPIQEPIALHITCSTSKMHLDETMIRLARRCATRVLLPEGVGCCAFAGDKGFTHPEVNAYALRNLRPQIAAAGIKQGYSNSRTCEIGLTTHSGVPYASIAYLADMCSRPASL